MFTTLRFPPPLGAAVLLAGLALSLPPSCRAADKAAAEKEKPAVYALLHIARHPSVALQNAGREPLDPAEPEEYRRLQVILVRSRRVLSAALRNPSVGMLAVIKGQKDPLAWMEKHVRAEQMLDPPSVLRVWVDGGSPREQAALANAVVSAYLAEVVNKERDQKVMRLEQMKELQTRYEKQLRQKREDLRRLAEDLGAGGAELDLRKRLALQEIDSLQHERLQVRAELRRLRLGKAAVKDKAEDAALEAEVEKALQGDRQLAALRGRVNQLENMLADVTEKSAPPRYLARAKDQLDEAKKSLEARHEQVRAAVVARLQERQRGQVDDRIRLLEKLSAQLDKELDEAIRSYGRLTREARPLVLEEVRAEIREAEELARKIGAQTRLLEVETDAPARVILLQEASAPK